MALATGAAATAHAVSTGAWGAGFVAFVLAALVVAAGAAAEAATVVAGAAVSAAVAATGAAALSAAAGSTGTTAVEPLFRVLAAALGVGAMATLVGAPYSMRSITRKPVCRCKSLTHANACVTQRFTMCTSMPGHC